jgi:predicted nucleic-acid-binding protein
MNALDTNVLIRFLVKDDPTQAEIIYRTLKEAEIGGEVFFVPLLVVLELIWVLDSVYRIPRQEIVDSLEVLLRMPVLRWEAHPVVQSLISSARDTRLVLADLLIAQSARHSGCERMLTFDQRACHFDFFSRLQF